jgi:hypothetical protein
MRTAAAVLLGTLLLGCGSSTAVSSPDGGIAGRYVLQTVNGLSLPATITLAPNVRQTVFGREFTLAAGGSMQGFVDVRSDAGGLTTGNVRTTTSGTYRVAGTSISITQVSETNGQRSPEVTFSGAIAGDGSISFETAERNTFRYKK